MEDALEKRVAKRVIERTKIALSVVGHHLRLGVEAILDYEDEAGADAERVSREDLVGSTVGEHARALYRRIVMRAAADAWASADYDTYRDRISHVTTRFLTSADTQLRKKLYDVAQEPDDMETE